MTPLMDTINGYIMTTINYQMSLEHPPPFDMSIYQEFKHNLMKILKAFLQSYVPERKELISTLMIKHCYRPLQGIPAGRS